MLDWVPSAPYTAEQLLEVLRILRDPENGCPWDKEQTFATIAPYTLEETYEVLDAIARELKIEVTEDDINAEFEKAGVKDVEASKAEFIADGRMPAVRESIRRSKAVDHLVENAKVTEVDETAKDAE